MSFEALHRTVNDLVSELRARIAELEAALSASNAERDEALSRVEELELEAGTVSTEFEGDCWKAMRRLLNECCFPWEDIDPADGVSADDAEEHIKTTIDELEKGEACQRSRADAAEAALSAEKAKVAEAVRERDNSRANSVSRGKKLLRLRTKLIEISDNIEHEGDRAYFGSTNDADSLREIFNWLDGFKWDRAMSESDEYDLLSSVERLLARAEAAEAEAARLREALILCQRNLAALVEPSVISGTTVIAAYDGCREAEAKARAALGGDHG